MTVGWSIYRMSATSGTGSPVWGTWHIWEGTGSITADMVGSRKQSSKSGKEHKTGSRKQSSTSSRGRGLEQHLRRVWSYFVAKRVVPH